VRNSHRYIASPTALSCPTLLNAHYLPPHPIPPTHTSSQVAVVANSFIIRKIDPASDLFMFSDNIFQVAERAGLYKPSDGLLDFLPTFGPMRAHSEYSTRSVYKSALWSAIWSAIYPICINYPSLYLSPSMYKLTHSLRYIKTLLC
jgi:hypothetical protein